MRVVVLATALWLLALSGAAWSQTSGWVLVSPPETRRAPNGKLIPNDEAPLSEWRYMSAHDTAGSCERQRNDLTLAVVDNMNNPLCQYE